MSKGKKSRSIAESRGRLFRDRAGPLVNSTYFLGIKSCQPKKKLLARFL